MINLRLAIGELRAAWAAGQQIMSVHYACENFYEITDRPVGVSCISFASLDSSSETTFSVIDRKEEGELFVLERFYEFMRNRPDCRIVHWNMNRSDYGFLAIDNRYTFLGKSVLYKHSSHLVYDLDDLLVSTFGRDYVDDPKLSTLGLLNDFNKRFMLSGKEEADCYAKNQHAVVRRSTSEKARLIAFLLERLLTNRLITKFSGPHVEFARATIDPVNILTTVADRFVDVARQLEKRHDGRDTLQLTDEYDSQDLLASLLRLFFHDIRTEEWTPSYAGGSSRIDFLIPDHALAVELKHGRKSLSARALGDQLIVDRSHYNTHPGVKTLVCLVFDEDGYIDNPRGIEKDLSRPKDEISVVVRIVDR